MTTPSLSGVFRRGGPLGLRVLVVDDNRDAADALGLLLQVLGADVRVCYDGLAAVAAADADWPHAGLLDVTMPGMDGVELAGRLRAAAGGRPLVLVAVTALGDDATRARTAAVFDLHLTKPADGVALYTALAGFRRAIGS